MATVADPILFFLCLNDRGGAESSMLAIARGLRDRGRDVTLAVYGGQPWLAREMGFTGIIVDLGVRRTIYAVLPLMRLLRRERFSNILSALPYTNIAAAIALRLARHFPGNKPRLFVTEHGVEGLNAAAASPVFSFLLRRYYARAAGVVAVSQRLGEKLRDFLPTGTPLSTIYNPVVPDILPGLLPPAHSWLVDREIPVIIAAGRLKPEKNFALLLRAFAQTTPSRKLNLIIMGEGDQRPMLELLAQELGIGAQVLLPGYKADLAAWLPYAALFVSASNREGLGNAIIEALGFGVPVVATDCPYGPREILQDGRVGTLVPMEDAAKLAQAIGDALDQAPDKEILQARALDFRASNCIDHYLALVDNQISK